MKPSTPVVTLALVSGCCLCFLAVALGAFGAHALESVLVGNGRLDTFETANRYHFYHSIALLVLGSLANSQNGFKSLLLVSYLFIGGVIVFCGSLYLLALTNVAWLGAITPIGGLLMLLGWLLLARDVLANRL